MNEESVVFIKELEEKLEGKISYRTYSTWYKSLNDNITREYGVFICIVNDKIYLEDFEKIPTLLGYPIKRKQREKYVQYSKMFDISQIRQMNRVRKNDAKNVLNSSTKLKQAGLLSKLFSQIVSEIVLDNGEHLYLELLNYKEFKAIVKK